MFDNCEVTLTGACGVEGCLSCLPAYIVVYDPSDGSISEYELDRLTYTFADK